MFDSISVACLIYLLMVEMHPVEWHPCLQTDDPAHILNIKQVH